MAAPLSLRPADRPLVLVVDDDENSLLLARESLGTAGFAVAEAVDGAEALEVFAQCRPDLVLLDVCMPRMDGFAALSELRKTAGGRHIPVLMMTGLDDLPSIRRAYEQGATDFVPKPINWLILGHRLEYMLRASRRAEELRHSRAKLAEAQHVARLGYWEWSPGGGELLLSGELAHILGTANADVVVRIDDYLGAVHDQDRETVRQWFSRAASEGGELEYRIVRHDGGERCVRQVVYAQSETEGAPCRTAIVQDVTERRDAEKQIQFLAYYDGLTGLPNRRAFRERLEIAVANTDRHDRVGAVLVVDIDRFKLINETLGFAAGDRMLQEIGGRLLASVRSTDGTGRPGPGDLVARCGGDKFGLLLGEISDPKDAAMIGRRAAAALAVPFSLDDREVFLTASIGLSVFPIDSKDPQVLFQNAEAAMFHSKELGGNSCQYYSESMNAAALERMTLETGLRRALAAGEFELYFQPEVALPGCEIVAVEALLRWHHPRLGMVLPGNFIPLAEEIGLIAEIGEWVLHAACRQAKAWQQAGLPPVRMAVNLSARQFVQWNLARIVAKALKDSGLEAHLLELELTESVLMSDEVLTRRLLGQLKALGVRLTVDDFGTGYSSLSYLRSFPLDTLKIDRSFLQGIPEQEDNAAISRAILAMAKGLRLQVVAEGVEDPAQLQFLVEEGCDLAQGFLLARPQKAEEIARLLARPVTEHPPQAAAAG
jgi:diguanylate cyclase (GGDEF)-like protein/PAS domain S-box-containing protein